MRAPLGGHAARGMDENLIVVYVRVRPGAAASTVFRAGLGPFRRRWQRLWLDAGQLGELRRCERLDVETECPFSGKPKDAPKTGAKTAKKRKSPQTPLKRPVSDFQGADG